LGEGFKKHSRESRDPPVLVDQASEDVISLDPSTLAVPSR
jgi:hypothetical protein